MTGNSVLAAMRERGPAMRVISLPHGRHPLHTMPTNAGYDRLQERTYHWDGRRRGNTPFAIVQHTLTGEGNLRFEGRHYRLRAGDTMLVMVPHDHCYWLEPGNNWEFFWMAMYGKEALRLQRALLIERGPVLRLTDKTIERLADNVDALIREPDLTAGRASALAYETLMALHDDLLMPDGTGDSSRPGIVATVQQHIHTCLRGEPGLAGDKLDVANLAHLAGLSRSHFSRQFTRAAGMSPAEYVLHERMKRAAYLLEITDLSVKAIALSVGIPDPNYFSKQFRRAFACSPSEFRLSGFYVNSLDKGGSELQEVDVSGDALAG
ncbi:AraC family transcriptional regulator [Azomonas macrocytogenes]|uniref:AraC-like DNA-binding protein n=1 Tax=Azomonas macrocytogenes TaxID=69962 RepID=A0A839T7X5_AZOMA|nr:AraC family transcriptional regulator [Azomonas macrocytogenes]MBB3105188.1 AraC-like DNA-binding protein [Azomonas macrocytogenes]